MDLVPLINNMDCRPTGNIFFHICCRIDSYRTHKNISFKQALSNYIYAYEFLPLRIFIWDNFNLTIYKNALVILFNKGE